jgi:hypothetical protein
VTAEAEVGPYYVNPTGDYVSTVQYMNTQDFIHIKHKHTEDPTFVNNKLLQLANEVSIYQNG